MYDTAVAEVEKIRSRYRVRLDDGTTYWLTRSVYSERPLSVGDEVESEEYANWVLLHQYRSALDKAVSMLAARACSKGEISQKLSRSGYSEETIEMVLFKLEKHDLLDDEAFAAQWANYRAGQKYGPRRIAQELKAKGLSSEDTENALEELDEDTQLEQAVILARKGFARAREGEDPRKTLQRVISSIVRRGYDWDVARQACDEALKEMDIEQQDDYGG